MMMMKVLLRAGRNHGRWQEAATSERLGLSRLLNTCFYLDSRPELRNTVREWPMGLKADCHIGRAQILTAFLAYRPHYDPPHRL